MRKLIRKFLNRFGYDIVRTRNIHASRRSPKERSVQVGKYKIYMPGNNTLLGTYKAYPDFNTHFSRIASAISKKYPGMTVVDVGANVGDTIAILRSEINVPVIGIEGDNVSFKFLEKNTGQFPDVKIVKTFLGEQTKDVNVELSNAGWNTTLLPSNDAKTTVSFKTLDSVLAGKEFNGAEIKLIKVDVEGFDTIVLRGSYDTIQKHKPVLFFEYNLDNMKAINEDGLSTLFSFVQYGYNKVVFFDCMGTVLLETSLRNASDIICLHNYASVKRNLLGYYDICIFNSQDDEVADSFLAAEKEHSKTHY